MKAHPLADLMPHMGREEYDELANSISERGLLEPIVVLDDKILDGRHRARACQERGVEPRYRPFEGDDPARYVFAANVQRRHLTPGQRAAIAAEMLEHFEAKAKARKTGRPSATQRNVRPRAQTSSPRRATAEVAKVTDASQRSVDRAARVKRVSPPTFRQVKAGNISLRSAERRIAPKPPKATPDAALLALVSALDDPTTALRRRMNEIKRAVKRADPVVRAHHRATLDRAQTAIAELLTAIERAEP